MAAVDWFAHATVAEPAPARRARQRKPVRRQPARPARTPRRRTRLRARAHILWMALFALLLAGVVAVNVAVLRAHVEVSRLDQQRAQLQARNQTLASQLSAKTSAPRVEAAAHRLGLVPEPGSNLTYLDLTPGRRR